uniref:Solute carrier organic anion transporter family member n=1 Tax=Caenorhabditis japonica TaxID=281687 RepID=A0A8R1DZ66_CAEJA
MGDRSVDDSAVGCSDDAETRSCPGDLRSDYSAQRTRSKWSHMRQASQGIPPRQMEKALRRKEVRLPPQQHELIEREMTVLTEESQCGLGSWRPRWLQWLGKKLPMIVLLCIYCSIQGLIVNGLVPSAISSIERRFKFSSSHMGRIVQFYDFGYVLFCIPVSYFGGRHSKPSVLAIGLACMALGSLIFSTPHIMSDSYSTSQSNMSLGTCSIENFFRNDTSSPEALAQTACKIENQTQHSSIDMYFYIFCFAHLLHGIGATPLFTIGVSYIDENVGTAKSSLFVGIFYSFAVFGPAIGFLAASVSLQYHTDFWHLPPEQILKVSSGETDPTWVGAWWLSFIVASFVGFVAVLPLASLPKVLPASLKWHRTRLQDAAVSNRRRTPECCGMPGSNKTAALYSDAPVPEQVSLLYSSIPTRGDGPLWYKIWLDVRHIPIAIYRILTNGPFMIITCAMAIDSLVVTGSSSFMSKYLERQFSVKPSKANLLIGCVMVPMAGMGCMITGGIVNHFRLNSSKMLKFAIGLIFLSLLFSPMYLIYCPHAPMVGVDSEYPDSEGVIPDYNMTYSKDPELVSSCNNQCSCDPSEYRPMCAELEDGRLFTYYSPCYAGCAESYSVSLKEYTECSCVPTITKQRPRIVKRGVCEPQCTELLGFLLFFAPLSFCTFAVAVPIISVILRTVDYNERSFALGIQWIMIRVIGTIPAPVLFGWMFDVSCIKYQSDSCGSSSSECLMYSNQLLANLFMTFTISGQVITLAILLVVLMIYGGTLNDDTNPTVPPIDVQLESTIPDRKELEPEDKTLLTQ